MSKRGKTRSKTLLQRYPERIAHAPGGNLVFTYPLRSSDIKSVVFLEMRDELNGKLFGRVDSQGQQLQCPNCKHDYTLSYEEFDQLCAIVLLTGKGYGWRCNHCKPAPFIIAIKVVKNQEGMSEVMVEITIK